MLWKCSLCTGTGKSPREQPTSLRLWPIIWLLKLKDATKPQLSRKRQAQLQKYKLPNAWVLFTPWRKTDSFLLFIFALYPKGSPAFLDALYAVPWGYFCLYYYRWLWEHKGKLSSSSPGELWMRCPVIQTEAPWGHRWICVCVCLCVSVCTRFKT